MRSTETRKLTNYATSLRGLILLCCLYSTVRIYLRLERDLKTIRVGSSIATPHNDKQFDMPLCKTCEDANEECLLLLAIVIDGPPQQHTLYVPGTVQGTPAALMREMTSLTIQGHILQYIQDEYCTYVRTRSVVRVYCTAFCCIMCMLYVCISASQ